MMMAAEAAHRVGKVTDEENEILGKSVLCVRVWMRARVLCVHVFKVI